MKPIIGILGRSETSLTEMSLISVQEKERMVVIKAGGIPILLLPPQCVSYRDSVPREMERLTPDECEMLDRELELVDGILLPGGDISYEYDRYVIKKAMEKNIPMLGICMGMQVMSFYNKPSNLKKIESDINHFHRKKKYVHATFIDIKSQLYEILNQEKIMVNSIHHYEIEKSNDFFISAISTDGVIEAIEYPELDFCIGVQFHPELNIDTDNNSKRLLEAFIASACAYHLKRV
ncbi:MAG: gamma-glutamyl-gamma-aminobutyrate hydrolase family protein [Firmicutes bacterium]|nr:gamma-glutamyl-gamma-aminobutyrate hydrolase family protein [Bacillota bacterium]